MKINLFYSWQSDLPNNSNRGLIQSCIEISLKEIFNENNNITEYKIESDSRDEVGTPDLVSSIFSKIDECDILLADISIINSNSELRKVPNPNVLIELGYASARIGWEKIICLFNKDYGRIEDLPFDIRSRKPLLYSTQNKETDKKNLKKILKIQIQNVIDNHIGNKKYIKSIKSEIDFGLQSILIELAKILYFREVPKCYNYNHLLHIDELTLISDLTNKKILGFQLFRTFDIEDFKNFFNDEVNMHFLDDKGRNILARIILALRDLKKVFNNIDYYQKCEKEMKFFLIDAHKMNPNNPEHSYILMEKKGKEQEIVLNSGSFSSNDLEYLLHYYIIKENCVASICQIILSLIEEINNWSRCTGDYFLFNERLFNHKL